MNAVAETLYQPGALEAVAEHMGRQLKETIEQEIERTIQGQTTPEAFQVTARAQMANPGFENFQTEAQVTVQPTPMAIIGNNVNFVPGVAPPTVRVTGYEYEERIEDQNLVANLGQQIMQISDRHVGQPIRPETVAALERDIAQAILAAGPPTEIAPVPPENEMVYNLGQAHNLYQYQATNVQVTQNNMPITVTIGGGTGAAGGGEITYRWVTDGIQPTLLANADMGQQGWNNAYTATTAGIYQTMGNLAGGYVGWDGGTGAATTAITYTTGAAGGTYNMWYNVDANGQWSTSYGQAPLSKKDQLKQKFRQQLSAVARKRRILDEIKRSPAELKARDTLRDMLSEAEWRRYVTNSFIMVKGASNKWYQVFANHDYERIRVYESNKHIANLCIHSDSECPPTDHVIAMKIQIELDEDSIWKDSNTFDQRGHGAGNININIPHDAGGVAVMQQGMQNPYVLGNVQGTVTCNGFHVTAEGEQVLGQMLAANQAQVLAANGIPEGVLQGGPATATEILAC